MRVIFFANTDWYLFNFRRSLAQAVVAAGADILLISPDGPYGDEMRASGLGWRAVPMRRRSLNPLREAWLLLHLVRLFRRERPDLIHAFTIKCAVYGSIAARLARVPARVNAVAGLGYIFISNAWTARLLRPLVRTLLKISLSGPGSVLILQNPDDVALFAQAGIVPLDSIRLIPGSGVDCRRFTFRRHAPRAGKILSVLFPARLLWDKGISELIDAARMLREQGRTIDFVVAGAPDPGNPASVPKSHVRGWETEGLIRWLGHVKEMPAIFKAADVVILPSYREGLPKGLIEGGASGCALVVSDVPGCRDVVANDGVDGLRVPARDARALAEAIARLDDDRTLVARLGEAARDRVCREFDEQIVIARTLAVYRELTGQMNTTSGNATRESL